MVENPSVGQLISISGDGVVDYHRLSGAEQYLVVAFYEKSVFTDCESANDDLVFAIYD